MSEQDVRAPRIRRMDRIKKSQHGSCTNAYHVPYIDELESERDRLKAQVVELEQRLARQAVTIHRRQESWHQMKARLEEAELVIRAHDPHEAALYFANRDKEAKNA